MMDEATRELLSRHLDGDLEPTQAARLQGMVDSDPVLALELSEMSRMRAAVRELAQREEPPEALDRLVAPLLRAPARRRVVRPFVPWLAAAATLVLGVSVALLVARSAGGPTPVATVAQRQAELPPAGRVGMDKLQQPPATDTEAEHEQTISAMQPSVVEPAKRRGEAVPKVAAPKPAPSDARKDMESQTGVEERNRLEFAPAPAPPPNDAVSQAETARPQAKREAELSERADGVAGGVSVSQAAAQKNRPRSASTTAAELRLLSDPNRTWQVIVPDGLPAAEYRLLLTVKGGAVVSCQTGDDETAAREKDDACGSLIGQALPGAEDGDRPALLEVHRQGSPAP